MVLLELRGSPAQGGRREAAASASGLRPSPVAAREVGVALDDMKFSAAHFVAYHGFREPLHGHNYSIAIRVGGEALQGDGYIVDFGELKRVARAACKLLNNRTLLPARSDVLQVKHLEGNPSQVEVLCEGGVRFNFPAADCALLPVVHTTAEELAEHLWLEILVKHGLGALTAGRGVQWMEVIVAERPNQSARYRNDVAHSLAVPRAGLGAPAVQVAQRPTPKPCLAVEDSERSADEDLLPAPADSSVTHLTTQAQAFDDVGEAAFRMLLSTLGVEESSRPELLRTPARAAKAFREMTAGLRVRDPLTAVGEGIFNVAEARDLVAVRDIPFHSLCEHHLLPFTGTAHVAYFPEGKVLGLSKFPRLLHVYARRLQLQERLTAQFAEALLQLLQPRALAVALEATHACMCTRGVGVDAITRTLVLRGPGQQHAPTRELLLNGVAFASGRARL